MFHRTATLLAVLLIGSSIVIADEGETWTAVAPTPHANDAASDGRAIRWMITAGGPGTSLLDLGEGEQHLDRRGHLGRRHRQAP